MFIDVIKQKSQVKGCRWDDIIMRFEYLSLELPSLSKNLNESKIAQAHKDAVYKHIA